MRRPRSVGARSLVSVGALALGGLAGLAALAGCESPPIRIKLAYQAGAVQSCRTARCEEVAVACDVVVHLRIISPSAQTLPYVNVCQAIVPEGNACAFADIELPPGRVPAETLEVQVAVWPRSAVGHNEDGELDCQRIYGQSMSVDFDAQGFPKSTAPAPALGGRSFFHPGDQETVVTLGCTDLDALNRRTCGGEEQLDISAKVRQFERPRSSVVPSSARNLHVSMVVPSYVQRTESYEVNLADTRSLGLAADGEPTWQASITNFQFPGPACVEVEENKNEATATLRCRHVLGGEQMLAFEGTFLREEDLDLIKTAVGEPSLDRGMTIGMLLNADGRPVAGVQIQSEPASSILFLSLDRVSGTFAVVNGATVTGESGLFVSLDAEFDTVFRALGPQGQVASAVGGRVEERVTLAVLEFE